MPALPNPNLVTRIQIKILRERLLRLALVVSPANFKHILFGQTRPRMRLTFREPHMANLGDWRQLFLDSHCCIRSCCCGLHGGTPLLIETLATTSLSVASRKVLLLP